MLTLHLFEEQLRKGHDRPPTALDLRWSTEVLVHADEVIVHSIVGDYVLKRGKVKMGVPDVHAAIRMPDEQTAEQVFVVLGEPGQEDTDKIDHINDLIRRFSTGASLVSVDGAPVLLRPHT